jgi:hypothetical protein
MGGLQCRRPLDLTSAAARTVSCSQVVMEYSEKGELFDYIVEKGRLMEDEARLFFQQIVSGEWWEEFEG